MVRRVLSLQQPALKAEMVNFVLEDSITDLLLSFVLSPQHSTSATNRVPPKIRLDANEVHAHAATSASSNSGGAGSTGSTPRNIKGTKPSAFFGGLQPIVLSYRAAHFLSGGFSTAFEDLSNNQQAALAHFYGVRTTQVRAYFSFVRPSTKFHFCLGFHVLLIANLQ